MTDCQVMFPGTGRKRGEVDVYLKWPLRLPPPYGEECRAVIPLMMARHMEPEVGGA